MNDKKDLLVIFNSLGEFEFLTRLVKLCDGFDWFGLYRSGGLDSILNELNEFGIDVTCLDY